MSKVFVKYLLILVLLSFQTSLKAQNTQQILSYGDELFDKGDYFGSIVIYENALNVDSSDAEVLYKYAKNLSLLNNHEKASRYFYKAYIIDRDKTYETLSFELAESYRNSGKNRKAKRYYSKAIRPYRRQKDTYCYKRISQSKKSNSWAPTKGKKSMDWEVKNLGQDFNSNSSEFSGSIYKDEIYYSALIADTSLENNIILDEDYFARIYKNKNELKFQESNKFKGKHLSNFSLATDNNVYFSVCDTSFRCEIWTGEYDGNQIKKVKKLNANINTSGDNNTQAQVVEINNETYLYFVSSRPKGFGGLDIWVSKKESFGFDKAINLGATVNSPDDEITPIYNPKNLRLYFSSNWHAGYGGFDIFKAFGGPIHFDKIENLYQPINTAADEYYFFPNTDRAILSSNRKDGNTDNTSNCCNDLFEVNYEEDEFLETDPEKIEVSVDVLNKYLPLDLYFHNDSPDPNTRDTTTDKNYKNLARSYLLLQNTYEEKYSRQLADSLSEEGIFEIQDFFENKIQAGVKSLEFFAPLLLKELEKGSQIELSIKGYASSISKSDYNLSLTLRRIESLINYLKNYDNGKIAPYLNQTAANKGSLKINKLPYGEFAVESDINEDNRDLAVYSPIAANQRKIEVLAITQTASGNVNMDGSASQKNAKVEITEKSINLNLTKENKGRFTIKNTGEGELKIYTVNANCKECIDIDYPRIISANGSSIISFEVDKIKLKKGSIITLSVFTNTSPNITELKVLVK